MKSLMLLCKGVLADAGTQCDTSTTFDLQTIERRVEAEGYSFLTITLANFGKDLEKGLDRGYVAHDLFKGFTFGGGLPRFLGGFLELVFDRGTGRLLDNPSISAVQCLRQITLMFGKVHLECAPHRVRKALDRYVECEQEVKVADLGFPKLEDQFVRISRLLFRDLFTSIDLAVYNGEHVPRHSGGATADKLYGNAKYSQTSWPVRLEEYFPHGEFLYPNWRYYDASRLNFLEPGAEMPVSVITVPKTLKTPRIIAMEPTAMQYAQQSLKEMIYDGVEGDNLLRPLIGFMDQVPNQRLAMEGSSNGSLATLDLSEASDRVSNQHVLALLSRWPHFREAVQSCRSRKADVLGKTIRLAKFASMGSALCFPMEAMVFLTVVFCGIENVLRRPLTRHDIYAMHGQVRVYGDDIIVPVDFVQSVVGHLEAFGFKVNRSKSFWSGNFRESCGKEYFHGSDVSIVRVKELLPVQRTDVQELESTVELRNHLYKSGYWRTVRFLDSWLEGVIPFPSVGPDSPVLGKFSYLGYESQRTDTSLQVPLVKGAVSEYILPVNPVEDEFALLKYFLKRGDTPLEGDHLRRSGRPNRARIKVGWYRSY